MFNERQTRILGTSCLKDDNSVSVVNSQSNTVQGAPHKLLIDRQFIEFCNL